MEVSQIYRQTNVKTLCNDVTLVTTVDLLEVELSSRAQEDEEERRKQKGANTASASHAQKGGGKGKPKPICRDFMTETGCPKGGQCLYQHPNTVGRCLRCGSTKHVVADCKRPRRDPTANANKGKGRSTSSTSAKSSTSQQAKAKAKNDPKKKAAPKGKGKPKPQSKASASAASSSTGQAQTAEMTVRSCGQQMLHKMSRCPMQKKQLYPQLVYLLHGLYSAC